MILTHAEISGFRNLRSVQLEPAPGFNIITGTNGAGKSSILEAFHLLSTGYSFRTRKIKELIHFETDQLAVVARLASFDPSFDSGVDGSGKKPNSYKTYHRAGIQKTRAGETTLKLDYEPLQSMSEMTRLIPVKALFPDSHRLIQDGPTGRRQFVDWGLFHVKHDFFRSWKQYRRALDQRNQSLKKQLPKSEIEAWNTELVASGEKITAHRAQYSEELGAWLKHFMRAFDVTGKGEEGAIGDISLTYNQGWIRELSLFDALEKSFHQCQRFRTTTVGPHRADLSIEFRNVPARQVMSRGQQKLLVYALHFAQLAMFANSSNRQAIVLCDDLPAELDGEYQLRIMESLNSMQLQTFITCNSPGDLLSATEAKLFHVKHGEVEEVV